MKERPILFSAPMVLAIMAGKKTQTRRIVKPAPGKQSEWLTDDLLNSVPHGELIKGGWQMHHPRAGQVMDGVHIEHDSPLGWIKGPYGVKDDQLWVREAFTVINGEPVYRSDKRDRNGNLIGEAAYGTTPVKWKPSIHMPRAFSRTQLEITDIRIERLVNITQGDAVAEGMDDTRDMKPEPGRIFLAGGPRAAFKELWRKINGEDSWDKNPWVWVVEFRKL